MCAEHALCLPPHRDLVSTEQREGESPHPEELGRPAKIARTGSRASPPGGAKSTQRHIETEQRRRDRINEGCGFCLYCTSTC